MDLVKEFKTAVHNPLNFRNLNVIFVTLFLVLIIGLSLASFLSIFEPAVGSKTACDTPMVKSINNSVVKNSDAVYNFSFNGNQQCFLNVWFTWKSTSQKITLWVYDPKGNVNIIEPTNTQTNVNFLANSPVTTGNWRVIVKTESTLSLPFSGQIAFR